ncbi:MAG: zf-HC2 domain-containing protein [bacterium]
MKKDKDKITRESCLDEELLSRYIHNLVSDNEREKIEHHLSQCSLCVDEFIFATRYQKDIVNENTWPQVPKQLQSRVLGIVKESRKKKEDIFRICLRIIKEQLDIVQHNGIVGLQPALAVRNSQDRAARSKKTLYKIIHGYHIEADIKRVSNTEIDVLVRVKEPGDNGLLKSTCFTLSKMDSQCREGLVLEEMVRDGEACFRGLESGEYCITVVQNGKKIGSIQIDLRN